MTHLSTEPMLTRFEEISEGTRASFTYVMTDAVYTAFLDAFDDRSPVHVEGEYARAVGFNDRVMHGAILNGFLSHFVGMRFPGRCALLLSADVRYLKPNYLGDQIELDAVVAQKVESQKVLVLNVNFRNRTQGIVVARGKVQVAVRDE